MVAIFLVVLLIAGLLVGPLWSGNTGYILVAFGEWSIETSIVAGVIVLTIVLIILRVIYQFFARLISGTRWGMQWFSLRRRSKAEREYQAALVSLLSQDFALAARHIERAYQLRKLHSDALLAVYINQQAGDLEKAQQWLAKTSETDDLALASLLLTLRQDPDLASNHLSELKALLERYPNHPELIRVAVESYRRLHRYESLAALLPRAKKLKVFSATELQELTEQAYYELMLAQGRLGSATLQEFWQNLSRDQRKTIGIRHAYIRVLIHFDLHSAADKVIARGLKRGELSLAVLLDKQLLVAGTELREFVQQGLKRTPDNAMMLQALGQIALLTKEYPLAQRALRRAADLAPSQRVLFDLAKTYEALGDTKAALKAYQDGLRLS
jgi:HemY protein